MRHDADVACFRELCLACHVWITATFSPELAKPPIAPDARPEKNSSGCR
jgi:hypothetical protein